MDEREFVQQIIENVERVIVGKQKIIKLLLVALLSDGHVLLEDVPGVGKTMLARSMAISLGGEFKRIQCTPDLMPNDVSGVSVFDQKDASFIFKPGPIFANILLVDEINRATPRTQSALLEAMQERQVTVDGHTYPLPDPFLVLATQNPIEYEGTFPLPEAQLDRFLMRISMGYPEQKDEQFLLRHLRHQHPVETLESVVRGQDLAVLRREIWDVHLDETLEEYIIRLVTATRVHNQIAVGCSPRASFGLMRSAQALAWIEGRDYVIPDDIQYLTPFIFNHRLIVKPEAQLHGHTAATILSEIINSVPLPLNSNT
jgi:MoxR-like ATPase